MEDLRRFIRSSREYRLEYGPFPLEGREGELKESVIKNIGGGGLMFSSAEELTIGRQLVMKIYLTGWRAKGEDIVEVEDEDSTVRITAVAEIVRCSEDQEAGLYSVGVRFLGRIL